MTNTRLPSSAISRCRRIVLAALIVSSAQAVSAASSSIDWNKQTAPGPVPRIEDTLVYDGATGRLIMFGGYDLNWNRTHDIWEYNGATKVWVEVTPSTGILPTRRSGHAMALDPVRRKVIVFGGLDDGLQYLADTWEWDTVNKSWTNVTPATSPIPRQGARLVYDTANDRMILLGGVDANHFFNETWAWNLAGRTWTKLAPGFSSPTGRTFSGRTFAGAAYNSSTSRITLFGGIGFPGTTTSGTVVDFDDIWELRGNTWTDVTPATGNPPGRGWTQLAFDSANNRMIMFAGFRLGAPVGSLADTWSFAGGSWTQIIPPAPAPLPRDSHGMAYDAARQRVVVFGGYWADVLELSGNTWSATDGAVRAPGQDQHAMAYDTDRGVAFLYGGGTLESFELTMPANSWQLFYVGGPNGRTGATVVYQPGRRKMLLFGGRQRASGTVGSKLGDTWEWDTAAHTWTAVSPANSPSARDDHAMTYDAAHGRAVLFGGRDANGAPLGDTWLWNGTAWGNMTATAAGPSARFGHTMTYDIARRTVVLFGGDSGSQKLNDVWEWDGAAERWRQLVPATSPPARAYAAAASFDAGTPGIAVFGGLGASLLNDTWIWNGTAWTQAPIADEAPTARMRAVMIYDPAAHQMVLYGGRDARGITADLWRSSVGGIHPVSADNIVVYHPGNGTWSALTASSGFAAKASYQWGVPGDQPLRADFDGDGHADLVVYRPDDGTWWVNYSSTNFTTSASYHWGTPGDVPLAGDFDGDGKADLVVYRPADGTWWINYSSSNYSNYSTYQWGAPGDQPLRADFDGDGEGDLAVFRPSNGMWLICLSSTGYNPSTAASYQWGLVGDVAIPEDFDGDGRSDLAVYRPNDGTWAILLSSGNFSPSSNVSYAWGVKGDRPVIGDLDADGRADLIVWRPSNGSWYVRFSASGYSFSTWRSFQLGQAGDVPPQTTLSWPNRDIGLYRPSTGVWTIANGLTAFTTTASYQWGAAGDRPLRADFDGDGRQDLVVYRPSDGTWWVKSSSTNFGPTATYQWGLPGDTPLPGDFDGDGRADLAIYRPGDGTWAIRYSSTNYSVGANGAYQWGLPGDLPLRADFDGDGKTDLAVYRPNDGMWWIRSSSSNFTSYVSYQWGLPGDVPMPEDFDGDGKTDLVVYRPGNGTWYVRFSSDNYSFDTRVSYQWGVSGDMPMLGDVDGDGRADPAIWRPSESRWYFLKSSSNYRHHRAYQSGQSGDVPLEVR